MGEISLNIKVSMPNPSSAKDSVRNRDKGQFSQLTEAKIMKQEKLQNDQVKFANNSN